MNDSAIRGFVERFHSILDELDEFASDDEMDELNAQLEDSIYVLECAQADSDDDVGDALDEIVSLAEEYRQRIQDYPDMEQSVRALEMAADMAQKNI